MAYTPFSGMTSITSTQPSSVLVGASIIGLTPVNVVSLPSSSVIAYQLAGSILATNATINNSSVTAFMGGTWSTSVVGVYQEKVAPTASALGIATLFKIDETNSVLSAVSPQSPFPIRGSVATLQGTNPWIVNMPSPSVIAIQLAGSILATSATVTMSNSSVSAFIESTNTSIFALIKNSSVTTLQGTNPWFVNVQGSVALGVGITSVSGVGLFNINHTGNGSVLGINQVTRNDTLTSILGIDLTTRKQMGDSIGRSVIKPFASEDSTIISYTGSVVSTSVTLIQASVTGSRSYITDFWVANTGSVATLITFQGGDTSIVGYTIAPGGGGSNSPGIAIPLKTTLSQDLAFKATTQTSVLYMTVKGYQGQ